MTTGFFSRATETTRANLLGGKTIRTPVSLPTDVADAKRSVTVDNGTPRHARPRMGVAPGDRRRLGTALGGLAAIFLVLTIAGVAARHIHVTPVTTTPSTPAGPAAARTTDATATDVARLSDATTAATAATSAVPTQLATFGPLPTPQQVSTVTGPYIDTLQLYETVLAATVAPPSAARPIRGIDGQLRTDIATFGGAGAVDSNQLGQFLNSFNLRVAVLEADMAKLEHTLHPSAKSGAA